MIEASFNGRVIAASDRTVVVEGNHYFPPDDVHLEFLQGTETATVCHWKGTASYYDVTVDGTRAADAGWTYREPLPEAARIKDHIAFWNGVEVVDRDATA